MQEVILEQIQKWALVYEINLPSSHTFEKYKGNIKDISLLNHITSTKHAFIQIQSRSALNSTLMCNILDIS